MRPPSSSVKPRQRCHKEITDQYHWWTQLKSSTKFLANETNSILKGCHDKESEIYGDARVVQ